MTLQLRNQAEQLEKQSAKIDELLKKMAENPTPQKPKGKRGRTGKGKILCLLERLRDYKGGHSALCS